MFVKYKDGSLMMVTGVEAPVYVKTTTWGWKVITWLGGNDEEPHYFHEDEAEAWRFFECVSKRIGGDSVLTLTEWIKLGMYQYPKVPNE